MSNTPDLIRVQFPNSGVAFTYTSQGERDRSLRLAEARQQLAHEGSFLPTWQELTDDERAMSEVEARNWLRAAARADLLAPVDEDEADDDAPIVPQSDSVYLDPAVRAAVRAECSSTCGKCRRPFDPADTRFDGAAEDRSTPGYCRSCVDRCHDGDSDHRCPICA
jgi:hypothetical protein